MRSWKSYFWTSTSFPKPAIVSHWKSRKASVRADANNITSGRHPSSFLSRRMQLQEYLSWNSNYRDCAGREGAFGYFCAQSYLWIYHKSPPSFRSWALFRNHYNYLSHISAEVLFIFSWTTFSTPLMKIMTSNVINLFHSRCSILSTSDYWTYLTTDHRVIETSRDVLKNISSHSF